jgi:hypothetical protein
MSLNIEELNKLPPAQRLAKIKEMQENLKKEELEAKKLEKDSRLLLENEKKAIDELIRRKMEEERKTDKKESKLEQTIQQTKEANEKPKQHVVDYTPGEKIPDSHYDPITSTNAEVFRQDINNTLYEKDPLYKGKKN